MDLVKNKINFSKLAYKPKTMRFKLAFLLTFIVSFCFAQLPEGFVYVKEIIPNIEVELRYCTDYNFVGEVIDG